MGAKQRLPSVRPKDAAGRPACAAPASPPRRAHALQPRRVPASRHADGAGAAPRRRACAARRAAAAGAARAPWPRPAAAAAAPPAAPPPPDGTPACRAG
eukprot:354398-Chlamydomonas_euryale.AAC.2